MAVANLCVPYFAKGFCPQELVPYVDRSVYPEAEYPVGQWDYQLHYEENFDAATRAMEADVRATVRALFRKGNPAMRGKPARLSTTRRDGGWFGGLGRAPDVPIDLDVITEHDLEHYAGALQRNGFFGPNSWYMNHARNQAYALKARDGGRLSLPVLFLHGELDFTCETVASRLAEPMRRDCAQPDRGHRAIGPLDGAGAAGQGQRRARALAGARAARALAGLSPRADTRPRRLSTIGGAA